MKLIPKDGDRLLKLADVARIFGVDVKTVARLRDFPLVVVSPRVRCVWKSDLDAYLARQTKEPPRAA